MATLLATWLMSALSVMILAWLLPGIHVSGFGGALVAALAIGLVNGLVRPILRLITLPITILTLGLFWLILNGICLVIADKLADIYHQHSGSGVGLDDDLPDDGTD